MESFSDLDNLLCFPSAAAAIVDVETQVEYNPGGGYVHIWFHVVPFHHMKSFHGLLVLDCSV